VKNELAGVTAVGCGLCAGWQHERQSGFDLIGQDRNNQPVYLKDIWPTSQEIARG
jgi:hypothetical protein